MEAVTDKFMARRIFLFLFFSVFFVSSRIAWKSPASLFLSRHSDFDNTNRVTSIYLFLVALCSPSLFLVPLSAFYEALVCVINVAEAKVELSEPQ